MGLLSYGFQTNSMQVLGGQCHPVSNLHLRVEMSWLEAFPQLSSHSSPAGNILNKVWFFSQLEKKQEGSERERNCLTLYQKQLFLLECHHFLLEVFQSQE